jgi:hypothetical protein
MGALADLVEKCRLLYEAGKPCGGSYIEGGMVCRVGGAGSKINGAKPKKVKKVTQKALVARVKATTKKYGAMAPQTRAARKAYHEHLRSKGVPISGGE